jgi:hypothetical protein
LVRDAISAYKTKIDRAQRNLADIKTKKLAKMSESSTDIWSALRVAHIIKRCRDDEDKALLTYAQEMRQIKNSNDGFFAKMLQRRNANRKLHKVQRRIRKVEKQLDKSGVRTIYEFLEHMGY